MKYIYSIAIVLVLASCNKGVNSCDCYEVHEKNVPVNVNGLPNLQWVHDYTTTPEADLCEKETGEYIYEGQTNRYKTTCN